MSRVFASYVTAVALASMPLTSVAHEGDEGEPPPIQEVIGDVGDVSFPISCKGDGVQITFDRGVALLHHMTYEVAEREFAKVAKADPTCAMAHWGIAITLVHPVWPGLPSEEIVSRGAAEIARARSLPQTDREAAYIEALGAFFDDWKDVDHRTRLGRWDKAQTAVREKYPDDDEALALAALIHIAAASKQDLEYRFNRDAGARLESLRARRPRHPGAVHYLIHAYDNPPLAKQALAAARSYDQIAPEVPHALHMPTHIFTRLGLWRESVRWNIRSRAAARKLVVDGAIYNEFGHASDYMSYAYLQMGQDADAVEARQVLFSAGRIMENFATAYAYAAVAVRFELERGDWQRAAEIAPRQPAGFPWDAFAACESIVHFARGIGAARTDQLELAQESAARLAQIANALDAGGLSYWSRQTRAQAAAVAAWIAHAEGDKKKALRLMGEAAEREDALDKSPVTPGAVLPARELYAEMLGLDGQWQQALEAYQATLAISPNRFNSLAGAARAAEEIGDDAAALRYHNRLLEIAGDGKTSRPGLERARSYLIAHSRELDGEMK